MTRKTLDISRRQMLLGIGGATLALPVLPSLLTRTAYGQDPVFTRTPRLFWLTTDHGAVFESAMFPNQSMLTDESAIFSDHAYASGRLLGSISGETRSVSSVLSADASRFSEALLAKMSVLYGLDVPFYIAHNTGLHLGNYARNDGNGSDGVAVQSDPRPTIDQIMAWSPSFYPDLSAIRERSLVMGYRPISWNYSSPSTQSGEIENVRASASSKELFDRIFVATGDTSPSRAPIVDRVRESYSLLRNGNRRLSAGDRQRLDDHMDRIAELERKLNTVTSCGNITSPTEDAEDHWRNDPAEVRRYCELFSDVVVAAFTCGTSRIAALGLDETARFIAYSGDWHQDVAHQWSSDESQALIAPSYQRVFEWLLLDLAAKLDVEEVPGATYLDNSLLVWSQESGMETHSSVSIPVVTFGSAAGYLKTGQFLDYRRTSNSDSRYDPGAGNTQYLGLLYSQWLATVLQSMGVPPAEFERWGHKGYGVPYLSAESWTPPYVDHYQSLDSRYFSMASDILPGLKA